MIDPADGRIAAPPVLGREVNGARASWRSGASGFGRELREGLPADLAAAARLRSRALDLVDIGDREEVRAAGAALFVRRRDELEPYDAVFERFWRRAIASARGDPATPIARHEPAAGRRGSRRRRCRRSPARSASQRRRAKHGTPITAPARRTTRTRRRGHHRSPRRVQPRRGHPAPGIRADEPGRAARGRAAHRPARAATRDAPDAAAGSCTPRPPARATGDVPAQPRHRRRLCRVALAAPSDIAATDGRAVRHQRLDGAPARLLLRFGQALAANAVRTEAFFFGTRLTRITRVLRDRDPDRALARV